MSSRYDQAFRDHSYLWTEYGPAADMTGGYVDQGDLDKLLANPTQKTAAECLESQIRYWFQVGTDNGSPEIISATDPNIEEIRERYGC